MISFNVPPYVGGELENINCAVSDRRISGDGEFTRKCHLWLEEHTGASKALLSV